MRIKEFIAGCLMAGMAFSGLADPVKGDTVRSFIQLGKVTLALPAGDWKVVADHKGTTLIDGMPTGPSSKGAYLMQVDAEHRLVGSFYARVSTSSAVVSSWSDPMCNRGDTLYRDTLDGNLKSPNCLLINHLTRYWQAVPTSDPEKQVWEWLQSEHVQVPQTALQVQTRFYRFGDFLQVTYSLNPELAGFEALPSSDWSSSEWHALKVKSDPARREFVERVKVYARQAAALHEAALRRAGLPGQELGPLPR